MIECICIASSLTAGEDYSFPGGENSVVLTVFGTVEGTRECVEIEIIDDDDVETVEVIFLYLKIINDSILDFAPVEISDNDGKFCISGDSINGSVGYIILMTSIIDILSHCIAVFVRWDTNSYTVDEGNFLDICVVATGQNGTGVVLIVEQYYSGSSGKRETCIIFLFLSVYGCNNLLTFECYAETVNARPSLLVP